MAVQIRNLVPWLARLALFALVFQVAAIDHQLRPGPDTVSGVLGSSSHEMHCHGASAGCANGGAEIPAAIQAPAALPAQPSPFLVAMAGETLIPDGSVVAPGSEPPRA